MSVDVINRCLRDKQVLLEKNTLCVVILEYSLVWVLRLCGAPSSSALPRSPYHLSPWSHRMDDSS